MQKHSALRYWSSYCWGWADWPEFRPLRNTSNWCVKTLLAPCCCTVTRALAVREIFSSFVRTGMQLCDNLFRGVFREYKSRLICSWRSPGILYLLLSPALSSLYILACVNWRIFAFQQLMMFAGWQIWKELIGLNTSRYYCLEIPRITFEDLFAFCFVLHFLR